MLAKLLEGKQCKPIREEHTLVLKCLYIYFQHRINYVIIDYGGVLSCC